MKQIILLMLILFTVGMLFATRATGYGISSSVTINTLLPPHSLLAQDLGVTVQLTWYPATLGTPDYYKVYGSATPSVSSSFVLVGETAETTFEDTYVLSAYYVTSVYSLGESRPSTIAYVSRMEPVRALLSIDDPRNTAVLTWDLMREAQGYMVYYSENPLASFPTAWQGPISITDNRYIDPLAQKRFYRVLAKVPSRAGQNPALWNSSPGSKK